MSLAHDLLAQAVELAAIQHSQSSSANFRRAISSAYYALFHLLIAEATALLCPRHPLQLASRLGRAFSHGDMKVVCRSISVPRSAIFVELLPDGISTNLRIVVTSFVDLQNERHTADYDPAIAYSRAECQAVLDLAHDAFSAWDKVGGSDEAAVFLTALLLHRQWSR